MFPPAACFLAGLCSGCAWIERPYLDQARGKIAALQSALDAAGADVRLPAEPNAEFEGTAPAFRFVAVAPGGLRDRVDLTMEARTLGLYAASPRETTGRRELLDLIACPALSPMLEKWLREFRRIPLAVQRGSVRLRVAPNGARGVWLDFANLDVKRLLEERDGLEALLASGASVEVGQRRKTLIAKNGALKLGDPVLKPWFETYGGRDERPFALFGPIGGFTQPGFQANRALVREAMAAFACADARNVVEFGSGNGNFTLPLAASGARVIACEIEALALQGLALSAQAAGLEERIELRRGDFSAPARASLALASADCAFVDPARPGLRGFLEAIAAQAAKERPRHFVYVSCFAESFAADLARLKRLGYRPESIAVVDQFPQSPHFEIVALLRGAHA